MRCPTCNREDFESRQSFGQHKRRCKEPTVSTKETRTAARQQVDDDWGDDPEPESEDEKPERIVCGRCSERFNDEVSKGIHVSRVHFGRG